MENLRQQSLEFLIDQEFDAFSLSIIDFKKNDFKSFQLVKTDEGIEIDGDSVYFDLASLSKPLTNSLGAFSEPSRVTKDMNLLLNHEAGLPSWGLLPRNGWKEIIEAYPIKKSTTLYSDFSALRFMLEFNKAGSETLHSVASKTWDDEIVFWKELPPYTRTSQNGYVDKRPNFRNVHDPNALTINDYVSHAGLFGTVQGVSKTLIEFNKKFKLLETMNREVTNSKSRFVMGWDTVENTKDTLAGSNCGDNIFGHLGFTGTSIWIDPAKHLGHVLLTNATKEHWYAKSGLNEFRKKIGEQIWPGQHF